jgi:hypothetical protein
MSTDIHVMCQSDEPPSLQDILDWLLEENYRVSYDAETITSDPDIPEWNTADMLIEEPHTAIQLDCLRSESVEFQKCCERFEGKVFDLDTIGEADPVRDHLAATEYIVRLQLPSDADDLTLEIAEVIYKTLAANEAGIVHIEGEGFLDSDGDPLLEV